MRAVHAVRASCGRSAPLRSDPLPRREGGPSALALVDELAVRPAIISTDHAGSDPGRDGSLRSPSGPSPSLANTLDHSSTVSAPKNSPSTRANRRESAEHL